MVATLMLDSEEAADACLLEYLEGEGLDFGVRYGAAYGRDLLLVLLDATPEQVSALRLLMAEANVEHTFFDRP